MFLLHMWLSMQPQWKCKYDYSNTIISFNVTDDNTKQSLQVNSTIIFANILTQQQQQLFFDKTFLGNWLQSSCWDENPNCSFLERGLTVLGSVCNSNKMGGQLQLQGNKKSSNKSEFACLLACKRKLAAREGNHFVRCKIVS